MSNEKSTAPLGKTIASAQSYDAKKMDSDIRDAISSLREEMHEMLQITWEDLDKLTYIEWKLDWKPVLTARLYPKKI